MGVGILGCRDSGCRDYGCHRKEDVIVIRIDIVISLQYPSVRNFIENYTHDVCRVSIRLPSRNPGYPGRCRGRRGTCRRPRYSAQT